MRTWATLGILAAAAACSGDDGGGGAIDAARVDAAEVDAALIDAAQLDAPAIDAPAIDAPIDARVVDAANADSGTTNTGFPTPTAPTRANQFSGGVWTELGPADWSCLGTPTTDQPGTTAIVLTGHVDDFASGGGVGAAAVTGFATNAPGTSLGTATTSDVAATRGDFTMTLAPLPAGVRRYGFRIDATGYLRSYECARYLVPGATQGIALTALAISTANALPAFVGVTRDPSTGMVTGTLVDCLGRAVSNAVATVSSAPGVLAELPGITTYYFSAGSTSLPVRHLQAPVMNKDGRFLILDGPPTTTAYAQVWGFRTAGDLAAGNLALLAEAPILLEADAVSGVRLAPLRTP